MHHVESAAVVREACQPGDWTVLVLDDSRLDGMANPACSRRCVQRFRGQASCCSC